MVLTLVSTGAAPVDRLLAAYQAGERSRGSARRPGSIFCSVWSGWQPPLKPSEINRPKSTRHPLQPVVRASPSPAPVPEAPAELSREEEIAQLRSWLDQPPAPVCRDRPATVGRTWRTWGRDLTGRLGAGVPTGSAGWPPGSLYRTAYDFGTECQMPCHPPPRRTRWFPRLGDLRGTGGGRVNRLDLRQIRRHG